MEKRLETGLGSLIVVTVFACGCVETPAATDARAAAHALDEPAHVAVDDFWLDEQIAAFNEKPAVRPKSLSLGYAGDSPLSGGVMRDTPIYYDEPTADPPSSCPLPPRSYSGGDYPRQ